MNDKATRLVLVATSDFSTVVKGRCVRAEDFHDGDTLGWVPANIGIGPTGHIASGIPFGATGDLRLRPDPRSRTVLPAAPGRDEGDVVLADLVEIDGGPWSGCLRTFLRDALDALRDEFGFEIRASLEHEFVVPTMDLEAFHPFSLRSFRDMEPIGSHIMASLSEAGLEPECWLTEYAAGQFEVTVRPTDALTAADRAVLLREIVRDQLVAHGHEVSFSPMPFVAGGGSGVHVHFSLVDRNGETVMFDGGRPGRLGDVAARFSAGIIQHAPALAAFFAPTAISYERLRPDNWSAGAAFLGLQNREALVRICPTVEIDGRNPRPQLHLEFRGADAGANPWLLVGLLVRAGLQGLREMLDPATVYAPGDAPSGEACPVLPRSLEEALEALDADDVVTSWFHPDVLETYRRLKAEELDHMSALDPEERCAAYRRVL